MTKLKKLALALVLGTTTVAGVAVAVTNSDGIIAAIAQECDHSGNHYSATDGNAKEYWICCKCHQEFYTQPHDGVWGDGDEHNSKYYVEDLEKFEYEIDDDGNVVIPELDDKDVDYEVDAENGEVIIHAVGDDERFNYGIDDEGNVVRESVKDEILEHLDSHDVDYEVDLENGEIIIDSVDGDDRFNYEVENDGSITIKGVDDKGQFRNDDGTYDITIPDGVDSVNFEDTDGDGKANNPFNKKNLGTVTVPESVTDLSNLFNGVADVNKVVFEGQRSEAETKELIGQICSAMIDTYMNGDWIDNFQVYFPSEIIINDVSYVTNNTAITGFGSSVTGKSAKGHVYYFKNSVPSVTKRTKKNSAFGYDAGEAYINSNNL